MRQAAILFLTATLALCSEGFCFDQQAANNGAVVVFKRGNPRRSLIWSGEKDAEGYANGDGKLTISVAGKAFAVYKGSMIKGQMTGSVAATYVEVRKCYVGEIENWEEHGKGTMYELDNGGNIISDSARGNVESGQLCWEFAVAATSND